MNWLQRRHLKACSWESTVTPFVVKKLYVAKETSRRCDLLLVGQVEYEVIERGIHYVVNTEGRTCLCKEWDITGIPCRHAAICISHRREPLETYYHPCFTKQSYFMVYSDFIHSILNMSMWSPLEVTPSTVLPPPLRRLPGRPKKNRRREPDEGASKSQRRSSTLRCAICKQCGHNKRTCQRATVRVIAFSSLTL